MSQTIIAQISQFLHNFPERKIDNAISELVRLALLDSLAAGIVGKREPVIQILSADLLSNTRSNTAPQGWSIVSGCSHLAPAQLALINATAFHAVDFDDTGASTQSHPSALLFPVLLALAPEAKATWLDFVKAYVAGLEVFNRMSQLTPDLHTKGWHPSSTIGCIAAASAAAVLLKLDIEQTKHSLSIAASSGSGIVANFGSMVKPLHLGLAAQSAVNAVRWAQRGLQGSLCVFDDTKNYFTALGFHIDITPNLKLDNFDTVDFAIVDPGLNIKMYPACALSHRLISIVLDLIQKENISYRNVAQVNCYATPKAKEILSIDIPNNGLEGKFSVKYLIARALASHDVNVTHFTDEHVLELDVINLMSKISFSVHPFWNDSTDPWTPDTVDILTSDGKKISGSCTYPKGHARNPVGINTVIQKFLNSCNTDSSIHYREFLEKFINVEFDSYVIDMISLLRVDFNETE